MASIHDRIIPEKVNTPITVIRPDVEILKGDTITIDIIINKNGGPSLTETIEYSPDNKTKNDKKTIPSITIEFIDKLIIVPEEPSQVINIKKH